MVQLSSQGPPSIAPERPREALFPVSRLKSARFRRAAKMVRARADAWARRFAGWLLFCGSCAAHRACLLSDATKTRLAFEIIQTPNAAAGAWLWQCRMAVLLSSTDEMGTHQHSSSCSASDACSAWLLGVG